MNLLNCDVTNCENNRDNMCVLQKINVEGPAACVKEQTCCASFCKNGTAQNNIQLHYGLDTNIACKAENCKYNRRGKCTAENINVTNMAQSPSVMGQTECKTFTAR